MSLALLVLLLMSACAQDASAYQLSNVFNNNTPCPATPEEIAALNMTPEQLAMVNTSSALIYPSGYIVMPWVVENLTEEQMKAINSTDSNPVSFWELPTWIQVSYLSGALVALAGAIALMPLLIRKLRGPSDNRNRDAVYRHIVSNPGCTAPDVSRGQSLNTGTVRYHIQRLELSGKIILKKIGKYTRLYKNSSTYTDQEMLIVSHLHNATSRRLLYAVLESPGTTNQRLAEQFGIDKSTVYVHMQRLVDDDIVIPQMDGKQKRYFVSEPAKPVLDKFAVAK
jgi:predicted transcriptional regulator